ncbi:MAG: Na+/H+ antiporter NhaC family protein [Pirellulaceae bacterium]
MHDFGWWSLVPPVVAIVMAIATRRVVVSLLIGLGVGALIWKGSPLAAIGGLTFMLRDSLAVYDDVEKAWDIGHIKVLLFTLMMGAMVGTVHRNGGMAAVARGVANWASNRRRGQLATWGLGLIIFIDDYANSLLVGHTMRPVTDRLKISREKLAYLVDSTAAPVAGLALISTWVAGEISYIRDGLAGVTFAEGTAVDAFQLFMLSIPTRFYVLWALLFVPIVAWLQRDFGPMLAAERRAATASDKPLEKDSAAPDMPMGHWASAVVPILVTVLVTFAWLVYSGLQSTEQSWSVLRTLVGWVDVIGGAGSTDALMFGSFVGWLVALIAGYRCGWVVLQRASKTGVQQVLPACAILWMAWTMSDMTDSSHLQTATFLASGIGESVAPWALPTIVFGLSSLVAFSTGTSWGTMGILMPIVIPTAVQVLENATGSPVSGTDTILIASIASVLAGAIWGDHCSPISDTTVLSSSASGCDHIAHVRTQMPYALLVGAISIACGTLPVGLGVPLALTHVAGISALVGLLWVFGKKI